MLTVVYLWMGCYAKELSSMALSKLLFTFIIDYELTLSFSIACKSLLSYRR